MRHRAEELAVQKWKGEIVGKLRAGCSCLEDPPSASPASLHVLVPFSVSASSALTRVFPLCVLYCGH